MENKMITWATISTIVSIASLISKLTADETDNKTVAKIQKVVDFVALASDPTKYTGK